MISGAGLIITSGMATKEAKIYTVGEVTSLIKVALAEKLPPKLTVSGEISDWKHHSSGHCYFSLKDANGILPCVMWKSKFDKVKFSPADGMAVIATGHIDVYPPQGKYQFYADKLEPAGVGALRLAFEQMAAKLMAEGLFEDEHKKPLPKYPMRIGIVTSASGAAIIDIADSIYNRWPCAKMLLQATEYASVLASGSVPGLRISHISRLLMPQPPRNLPAISRSSGSSSILLFVKSTRSILPAYP